MAEDEKSVEDFLAEIDSGEFDDIDFDDSNKKKEPIGVDPITTENAREKVLEGLANLLPTLDRVIGTLAEKVEAGDTYESTLQGVASVANVVISGLKAADAIDARENKMKHEENMKKLQHEQKLKEIEVREEKKANGLPKLGSGNTVNVFHGSPTDFFKQVSIEHKKVEDANVVDID